MKLQYGNKDLEKAKSGQEIEFCGMKCMAHHVHYIISRTSGWKSKILQKFSAIDTKQLWLIGINVKYEATKTGYSSTKCNTIKFEIGDNITIFGYWGLVWLIGLFIPISFTIYFHYLTRNASRIKEKFGKFMKVCIQSSFTQTIFILSSNEVIKQ